LTQKQITKAVYDQNYQKFFEDPTHFNTYMKYSTWLDYINESEENPDPKWIEAVKKAQDKYNKLVDEGKGSQYWRTCPECKIEFSGRKMQTKCDKCGEDDDTKNDDN